MPSCGPLAELQQALEKAEQRIVALSGLNDELAERLVQSFDNEDQFRAAEARMRSEIDALTERLELAQTRKATEEVGVGCCMPVRLADVEQHPRVQFLAQKNDLLEAENARLKADARRGSRGRAEKGTETQPSLNDAAVLCAMPIKLADVLSHPRVEYLAKRVQVLEPENERLKGESSKLRRQVEQGKKHQTVLEGLQHQNHRDMAVILQRHEEREASLLEQLRGASAEHAELAAQLEAEKAEKEGPKRTLAGLLAEQEALRESAHLANVLGAATNKMVAELRAEKESMAAALQGLEAAKAAEVADLHDRLLAAEGRPVEEFLALEVRGEEGDEGDARAPAHVLAGVALLALPPDWLRSPSISEWQRAQVFHVQEQESPSLAFADRFSGWTQSAALGELLSSTAGAQRSRELR